MSVLIDLGLLAFILCFCTVILWYIRYAYKVTKGEIMRQEVYNAYFLKRMRLEIEGKDIDFDEMMREYHEETRIFRKREDDRGILEAIDEEVKGEVEETNDKKGKK